MPYYKVKIEMDYHDKDTIQRSCDRISPFNRVKILESVHSITNLNGVDSLYFIIIFPKELPKDTP